MGRIIAIMVTVGLAGIGGGVLRAADEAVLLDGRHVEGRLDRDGQGRLTFAPSGANAPLSLTQVQQVCLAAQPVAPLLAAAFHRVTLFDGQTLTGELLGFDAERLRLRTGWAEEVTLPRHALSALTQPTGWATTWIEDFEAEPKNWKLTGTTFTKEPALGKRSLLLSGAGQTAEYTPSEPLSSGRFGVAFRQGDKAAGLRWLAELEFQVKGGPQTVRVEVGGDAPDYAVEVSGSTEKGRRVMRSPGWHRLDVEFSATALVIAVDDAVLWHDRRHGPGGPLDHVRLACVAAGDAMPQGTLAFDDVSLATAVTSMRHSAPDPGQDEVWLTSGDGVFGKLLRADRQQIALQTSSGERTRELSFNWGDVRGLFLRRAAAPLRTSTGDHVRLWLRSGIGTQIDQIEGIVTGLDDKHLTLTHPLLGEQKIGRERLERLRWHFHGRRVELDNDFRQIDASDQTAWKVTCPLEEAVRTGRLIVNVTAPFKGEPRLGVVVNGKVVGSLRGAWDSPMMGATTPHDPPGARSPVAVRLTVPLPDGSFKVGDNIVELRPTAGSCGVFGVWLELPD